MSPSRHLHLGILGSLRWPRAGLAGPCIQLASIDFLGRVGNMARLSSGAVAQLGERLICIQEVAGSIPTSSTRCRAAVDAWACSSGG